MRKTKMRPLMTGAILGAALLLNAPFDRGVLSARAAENTGQAGDIRQIETRAPALAQSNETSRRASDAFAQEKVPAALTDQVLADLFQRYWAYEMKQDPFAATSAGINEFNDEAPDVSPEAIDARNKVRRTFLSQLNAIDLDSASPNMAVSAGILRFILKSNVARAPYKAWRAPFLSDSGFHMRMGFVVGATPFRTEADYDAYLTRLSALPAYLDQNVANMRQGIAEGFTQPAEIMPGILPSFEAQANKAATAHPLFKPFDRIPGTIGAAKSRKLKRRAENVMEREVIPAFKRVETFMKDEYVPAAIDKVGAQYLPNGDEYYRTLVRFYTSLDDATPDAIHELGLKEVARIRAEMDEVIQDTGFNGDFDAFLEFLRTDEQFYADTAEELLKEVAHIAKDIDGKLPKLFGKLPRQPYSVEPVPAEIASNYTSGRYVGAPLDGDRGGQYWVNTYDLKTRPLYEYVALSLHEAMPGHHLQSALALEIENVPAFRKEFYPHAYGEGWGLYSEKLGVELDVYRTPYDHFGRLSFEMWRAARLVIDTGLHSKGWTREQAIDYLAGNTALSLHNVTTEIDRYIAWPGQALSYKMGELTILELRAKAERELGDKFSIRDFHDAVLDRGGVPLDLLRQRIDEYIAEASGE